MVSGTQSEYTKSFASNISYSIAISYSILNIYVVILYIYYRKEDSRKGSKKGSNGDKISKKNG